MDTIEILKNLVSYNTINDTKTNEVMEWIIKYLTKNGFECEKMLNQDNKKCCLIAQLGKNPILGFSGHIDTVDINNGWSRDPFKLTIEENKIYGLGVSDMKGGIAAFIKACTDFAKLDLKRGITLYLTFGEETDFGGIQLLTEENVKFPKYLILAEPTDLEPVYKTKGLLEMEVKFFGKSAHSSTPIYGKNAIVKANDFIKKLQTLSTQLKKETDDEYSVPYSTINIGKISGGIASNIVPNECSLMFDVRTIKKEDNAVIKDKIIRLLDNYDCEYSIDTDIKAYKNSSKMMVEKVERITDKRRKAENYLTEASLINNTNMIILGVGPNTAHQSDEYIERGKLNMLVNNYKEIIENFCF